MTEEFVQKIVRPAEPSDKAQIIELNQLSYGFSPGELKELKKNFDITYPDHLALCEKDKILAVLRNIRLQQNIRGVMKPMSGIAMVASGPESRGQGNIRQLITETFYFNYKAGIAVSTLYPFKDTYYANFGYINTTPHRFIEINPAWLGRWNALPEGYYLKRSKNNQIEAQNAFQELHQHTINKFHGGVQRPSKRWDEYLQDNQNIAVIVYNSQHEIEGFLSYSLSGYGYKLFDERTIGSFRRVQFLYKTLAAKHALFYYIYQHRDQIHKVILPLYPHDENYYNWCQDFTKANIRQHLQTMARIINIEAAFSEIEVLSPGTFTFSVSDPLAPWNSGIYTLFSRESNDGYLRLGIKKENDEPDYSEPTFSIGALTGLLYGTISISEMCYFQWIQRLKEKEKKLLTTWFPRLPYCLSEFF